MNKEYRVTLLREEKCEYELDQEVAESFRGFDIQSNSHSEKEVTGVVNDCWYNDDIIAKVTIYDEKIINRIDDDMIGICPTVARNFDGEDNIRGVNIFLSPNPSEEVGEVEPVE